MERTDGAFTKKSQINPELKLIVLRGFIRGRIVTKQIDTEQNCNVPFSK